MTMLFKKSTSTWYQFFMADPTDMTQGKTGLAASLTLRSSGPAGASFFVASPTFVEIGDGWYKCDISLSTLGRTVIECYASGAVTWREIVHVVDELPGNLTDAQIAEIVAKIFRTTMDAIEDSSEGTAITTTNLSLYKAVMSLVGKVALISTTKRIYQTDETTTALDLTMTSGQGPASPFISQEP